MNDEPLTPLFILAVSLAYVIQADEKTARDIREFLMLKNDISLFTDSSHPFNDDDFSLGHLFQDARGGGA